MATKKTRDAIQIIKHRFGIDPRTDARVQAFAEDFRVAQMIYDARQAAGMTQQELARAIGTTQSVISQLEDADYHGHSLSVLRRIASALGMRVEMRMVPRSRRRQRA